MSKDGKPDRCIAYVSEKVGGKFSALPCVAGVSCLKNRTSVEFSTEKGAGGSVTIHAVVDGLIQKYVFTPV